jgi:glycosyltransferase involved in cell wall biosynthesis
MHGAHNTAYRNITTELNVCIDSDDWMPDNAVELIVNFWKENGSDKYAGLIGYDQCEDLSVIGSAFDKDLKETTLSEYYNNGGTGDKKLVYRTDVVNQYPEYPLFEGERYVGLAYKYMLIDEDYNLLVLNKPLATIEYQTDGSSNSMYKQYWRNPKGFAFYRKTEMQLAKKFSRRFVSNIHYVSSSIIARNRFFIAESPKKLMTICAIPFGVALFFLIRHKVNSNAIYTIK